METDSALEAPSDFNRLAWKAWKLSSTRGMMMSLAEEKNEVVQLGVAWNPQTPRHIIDLLSLSDYERVRNACYLRLKENI